MARMLPPVLPPETHSEGEKQLYRMLQEQLPDDYTVLHGVDWSYQGMSHVQKGELDFLVVHRELGMIIVEVKDQSVIDIKSGRWQSRENGQTPPQQIDRHQRGLRRMLKEARVTRSFDYEGRVHTCLSFTNLIVPEGDWLNRDLLRSQVIDLRDCDDLEGSIRRVSGQRPGSLKLDRAAIDAMVELLARDLSIRAPELYLKLRDSERQFVELSPRQFEVLNMLLGTKRLAIPGCAGSGKTMLAIESARRLARQGFRVLLTCHTKELAATIREQVHAEPEPALENVTIEHFHGLASRLIGQHEFKKLSGEHRGPSDKFWNEIVPEKLVEHVLEGGERFDAIIVDEGQDFGELAWYALEYLLENPEEDVLYVFFDSNPRVFRRNVHFSVEISPLHLNTNFRNTNQIHELVRNYHAMPESIVGSGINGEEPSQLLPENGDLSKTLQRLLHRLVNKNDFKPEDIVVLTPVNENNSNTVLKPSVRLGNFTLTRGDRKNTNDILVRTIHSFKGRESPVAIVVEFEHAHKPSLPEIAYVGLSRARSQLYVIGELPPIPSSERAFTYRAHGMSERPHAAMAAQKSETIQARPSETREPVANDPVPVVEHVEEESSPLSDQIELDSDQKEIVAHAARPGVSLLVTGGPGSGKSLVLMHAAAKIGQDIKRRGNVPHRTLFTTFTNALVRASRQQLNELMGSERRLVHTTTADSVARNLVNEIDGEPDLVTSRYELLRLVNAARARVFPEDTTDVGERNARRSIEYLETDAILDEIEHVIIARGFETIDEYQAFDPGRVGLRLNERQRDAIWRVAREFEALITREGKLTWPLLRRRALDLVLQGHWRGRYDSVIVDEAQDLDLSSLRMLQELCPVHGRFLVSADPNQSIYPVRVDINRDLAASFNRRNLNTSYRTNREIMEAAREFVASKRIALPPQPDDYPTSGRLPMVRTAESPANECQLISEFLKWASGTRGHDMAKCCVLVPTNSRGEEIADSLADNGIPTIWMPGKRLDLRAKAVKVMTLHAAKGLEFQNVIIAGFVPPSKQEMKLPSNGALDHDPMMLSKLLYVGMTRAIDKLMIIRPSGENEIFAGIGDSHWNAVPGSANPVLSDDQVDDARRKRQERLS